MYIIDRDFIILRANKSFSQFVIQPVREVPGNKCYALQWNRKSLCHECPVKITFEQGIPIIKKLISRSENETVKYYEMSTFPVKDDSGQTIHVIIFTKDITEEKQMIEQIIRSEKLASIGNMTAGIAHEMNNPLSGISGNATNLLKMPQKYGLNEKGISRITTILNSAAHATAIMNDLLHLSNRPEQTNILVNINALLAKTANAVHINGSQDIERSFNFDEHLPPVKCDPSKIQQVIVHIITNAIMAILDKKNTIQNDSPFKGQIVLSTQQKNSQVLITIADNGIGISEEHRSKIFDPFFSTRPTGQGTGLGLSVSTKIIEQHSGQIFYETINSMTQFSILLPLEKCEPEFADYLKK
ncbi:MAG: PAS domain-containing protein [Chitinispirillaceae bacterium]|nr:PAS domain-containing protein [Chitinispirillaceae bacterium]